MAAFIWIEVGRMRHYPGKVVSAEVFILLRGNTERPTTTWFWAQKLLQQATKALFWRKDRPYTKNLIDTEVVTPEPLKKTNHCQNHCALGYGWSLLVVMQAGCLCVWERQEVCAWCCCALTERTQKNCLQAKKNKNGCGREFEKEDRRVLQICS